MKKTQRFFALILCVMMLLSILGCGQNNPQPSQTVQESAPESSSPESAAPNVQQTEQQDLSIYSGSGNLYEHSLVASLMDQRMKISHPTKQSSISFTDDIVFIDVAKEAKGYYYILASETETKYYGSDIYYITLGDEPRLIYSHDSYLTNIAVDKTHIYFVSEEKLYCISKEGGEPEFICEVGEISKFEVLDNSTVILIKITAGDGRLRTITDVIFAYQPYAENWELTAYDMTTGQFCEYPNDEYIRLLNPENLPDERLVYRYIKNTETLRLIDRYSLSSIDICNGTVRGWSSCFNEKYDANVDVVFENNGKAYKYTPFEELKVIFDEQYIDSIDILENTSYMVCDKKVYKMNCITEEYEYIYTIPFEYTRLSLRGTRGNIEPHFEQFTDSNNHTLTLEEYESLPDGESRNLHYAKYVYKGIDEDGNALFDLTTREKFIK